MGLRQSRAPGSTFHPLALVDSMVLKALDTQTSPHSTAFLAEVFLATALFQLPFFDLWFIFMDEGHRVQFFDIARGG